MSGQVLDKWTRAQALATPAEAVDAVHARYWVFARAAERLAQRRHGEVNRLLAHQTMHGYNGLLAAGIRLTLEQIRCQRLTQAVLEAAAAMRASPAPKPKPAESRWSRALKTPSHEVAADETDYWVFAHSVQHLATSDLSLDEITVLRVLREVGAAEGLRTPPSRASLARVMPYVIKWSARYRAKLRKDRASPSQLLPEPPPGGITWTVARESRERQWRLRQARLQDRAARTRRAKASESGLPIEDLVTLDNGWTAGDRARKVPALHIPQPWPWSKPWSNPAQALAAAASAPASLASPSGTPPCAPCRSRCTSRRHRRAHPRHRARRG